MPHVHRLLREDGLAVLQLGGEESAANCLDHLFLEELHTHLRALRGQEVGLRGLLLHSSVPGVFATGPDLSRLAETSSEELELTLKLGEEVCSLLASWPVPTVAALGGSCLGYGLSLALACDWRVAARSPEITFGFPECALGLLPGFGATLRLPRLVGRESAWSMVTEAQQLTPPSALFRGLVDALAPEAHLLTEAAAWVARGRRRRGSGWGARLFSPLRQAQARKARTHAQADMVETLSRAAPLLLSGLSPEDPVALRQEREAILALARTPGVARQLRWRLWLERQQEGEESQAPLPRIALLGHGKEAAELAWAFTAQAGRVLLQGATPEKTAATTALLGEERAWAEQSRLLSPLEALARQDRVQPTAAKPPLASFPAVLVLAPGEPASLAEVAAQSSEPAFLGADPGGQTAAELFAGLSPSRSRVALRFHRAQGGPAWLVEITPTTETSAEALAQARSLVRQIQGVPLLVQDSPGGFVARMRLALGLAAAAALRKDLPPADLDHALQRSGFRWEPLRWLDEHGLRTAHALAARGQAREAEGFPPAALLERMLAAGLEGQSNGRGFYLWQAAKPLRSNPELLALLPRLPRSARPSVAALIPSLVSQLAQAARQSVQAGLIASTEDAHSALLTAGVFPVTQESLFPAAEAEFRKS